MVAPIFYFIYFYSYLNLPLYILAKSGHTSTLFSFISSVKHMYIYTHIYTYDINSCNLNTQPFIFFISLAIVIATSIFKLSNILVVGTYSRIELTIPVLPRSCHGHTGLSKGIKVSAGACKSQQGSKRLSSGRPACYC